MYKSSWPDTIILGCMGNLFQLAWKDHWTIAKSLSELRLLLLALCPGRKNSIFLFFASVFFLCFLIFFLAAMSGLVTAWQTKRKIKKSNHDKNAEAGLHLNFYTWALFPCETLPAGPCVSSVRLVSVQTPSAQLQRRARTSQDPPASSAAQWVPEPDSSVWGLM